MPADKAKKSRHTALRIRFIQNKLSFCGGVLWFPPQKVGSLKKGRGKKRKEKEEEENIKQRLIDWKEKEKKNTEKKSPKTTANFGRGETKFAS